MSHAPGSAKYSATNSPSCKKMLIAGNRHQEVLRRRLAGEYLSSIAKSLDISVRQCSRILKKALEKRDAETKELESTYRAQELSRLDSILEILWRSRELTTDDGNVVPNLPVIDRIHDNIDRRSAILGLKAPTKVESSNTHASVVVMVPEEDKLPVVDSTNLIDAKPEYIGDGDKDAERAE